MPDNKHQITWDVDKMITLEMKNIASPVLSKYVSQPSQSGDLGKKLHPPSQVMFYDHMQGYFFINRILCVAFSYVNKHTNQSNYIN